jgi:hypothetical protein
MAGDIWPENVDCVSKLMDILSYEVCTGRMSPEMWDILEKHLGTCPCCQQRFTSFLEILEDCEAPTRVC